MSTRVLRTLGSLVAFIFLTGSVVFAAQAQEEQHESEIPTDRWTPALSMQYRAVRGTAMSPRGDLVAYVVREPIMDGEKSEYLSHIWVVSTDGSMNVQFTQGDKSATNPSFSPDGTYLAFTSSRGNEETQIWLMRVRGGEAFQLTDQQNGVGSYRWSPDGSKIAFTMRDPDTEEEEKAQKEKRDVILVDQVFKYAHIYTIAIEPNDEGEREVGRLTAGDFHVTSLDWSPDGRTIVFGHQPDPRINESIRQDISTVPADSGAVTRLIARTGSDHSPRYSPDGSMIAFVSHGGSVERVGLGDLYIVPAGGGQPTKLAETPDRSASLLAWSGDGERLFVTEAVKTTRQLIAVPVDGSEPEILTDENGVMGSFSFNRDASQAAFTYQESDIPVDVYATTTAGLGIAKLTDLHANVARPPMGRTELISWRSYDGFEIEGLLTYPVNYQEGRRYPLILNIHGGPAGVYTRSFTGNPSIYMLQYFAQQGFAVLRANPRGSSGYGKEFRYANVKDWGYGDYEDVMSGVDKVIEMGVGHADSLAVMGWSYGGYLTSFLVTRTERFKAASMGAGLPNLISMVSTTDIPDYLVAHMGGNEFWDDYETYEKHSAMYRIKNVITPTQVIHGQNDLRVPFTQGQEFYVALSRLGVPTEMIVYPRTPHGPREPKFLMDVSERILSWFNKHLQKDAGVAAAGARP